MHLAIGRELEEGLAAEEAWAARFRLAPSAYGVWDLERVQLTAVIMSWQRPPPGWIKVGLVLERQRDQAYVDQEHWRPMVEDPLQGEQELLPWGAWHYALLVPRGRLAALVLTGLDYHD